MHIIEGLFSRPLNTATDVSNRLPHKSLAINAKTQYSYITLLEGIKSLSVTFVKVSDKCDFINSALITIIQFNSLRNAHRLNVEEVTIDIVYDALCSITPLHVTDLTFNELECALCSLAGRSGGRINAVEREDCTQTKCPESRDECTYITHDRS